MAKGSKNKGKSPAPLSSIPEAASSADSDSSGFKGVYYGFGPFRAELSSEDTCQTHYDYDLSQLQATVTPLLRSVQFLAIDLFPRMCSTTNALHWTTELPTLAQQFYDLLRHLPNTVPVRFTCLIFLSHYY